MQLGTRRLNRQTWQCHQDRHTSLCYQPKLVLPHRALPCAKRHRDARRSKLAQPTAALAPDPGAGDERVQETLVDIIGVQIGQQHVKDYFDDESDKLRKTAEEVRLKLSLACPPGLQHLFVAHYTSWCTHAAVCRCAHEHGSSCSHQGPRDAGKGRGGPHGSAADGPLLARIRLRHGVQLYNTLSL